MAVTVSAAAAKPPPSRKAREPRAATAAVTPDVTAARTAALIDIASIPVAACIATGRLADAGTIQMYWPKFAAELAAIGEKQEEVGKLLDPLTRIGPYTKILAVGLPMAYQFAVNHGKAKAGGMGSVSPELIAAKIETQIAQAEAESLREQLAALRESRELAAEIETARNELANAEKQSA
jgi:hypothetical protein